MQAKDLKRKSLSKEGFIRDEFGGYCCKKIKTEHLES